MLKNLPYLMNFDAFWGDNILWFGFADQFWSMRLVFGVMEIGSATPTLLRGSRLGSVWTRLRLAGLNGQCTLLNEFDAFGNFQQSDFRHHSATKAYRPISQAPNAPWGWSPVLCPRRLRKRSFRRDLRPGAGSQAFAEQV